MPFWMAIQQALSKLLEICTHCDPATPFLTIYPVRMLNMVQVRKQVRKKVFVVYSKNTTVKINCIYWCTIKTISIYIQVHAPVSKI